jgi:hypothetical protein
MTRPISRSSCRHPPPRPSRALTVVELLVALSIVAVVSTAVTTLLYAGGKVNSFVTSSIDTQWEVEAAVNRIAQEIRTCDPLNLVNVPTGTGGGAFCSFVTQPDPANGNQTYDVSLQLMQASDGTWQLWESQYLHGTTTPRFAGQPSAVILHNVQSFDVRTKTAGLPQVVTITMTAGRNPPVTRTLTIAPRNQ